jgi:hypothetical protein
MQIITVPSYENIFEGNCPAIEDILKNIPSKATITICSFINAQLYDKGLYNSENHVGILGLLIRHLPEKIKSEISQRFIAFGSQHPDSLIFSMQYCCELILWEIAHYREGEFDDTTPAQHFSVLQALLVVSSILNDRHLDVISPLKETDDLLFQRAFWPEVLQF